MIILTIILAVYALAQVMEFLNDLRVVLGHLHFREAFDDRFDLVLDVGHEHRVIGRKIAARFLNDRRVRHIFVIANVFDDVNYVVCKLLCVVVCR